MTDMEELVAEDDELLPLVLEEDLRGISRKCDQSMCEER